MAHQPKPATVAAYQTLRATKIADTEATFGAIVGVNLFLKDGSLFDPNNTSEGTGPGVDTSDDVQEGQYNLYFTNQRAQDAVGGILTDTATIDFTYNQTTHSITADLKDLASTVGGSLIGITRDSKGRISQTKPVNPGDGIAITDSGTALTISLVGLPIYLVDEAGNQLTDESGNFLTDTATTGLPVNWTDVLSTPTTLAGYGITDAQRVGDPVRYPEYTLTTLPSAATYKGCMVICTNLTEGYRLVFSDGTNWLRLTNNTVAN